ncbi:hypothetical protein llap_9882 [Limosa lapponica baueri]|uniref:Leucine-rich repeat and calponin homology domain-containing protein 3 n=1 Tax=Limosa lapponica baueri TaxID=1758121 RepID=A0A2I0U1I0_LIMLA|nr:hypothetical protein llap_9882 [Limosa lapponica baueri]
MPSGNVSACPPPPGGPSGPGSWSRSLDRALEEAAASGTLSLSGRKLRDYPRASAASHDLSDTTQADLSRNRLSELPAEACHFVSLESLNLYQNCIRYIPEAVLNLQSLTFLNISRNQLSTLPVHLCSLPLKVLIASNNKLVSIPEEIGQLRQLTELDVSCNEIQTIPPQIGNLESLRDLNVRRNNLVRLPEELAELPLIRLDFSCNKITTIPVCYRNLRHLQTIMLENNPLQSPPAQICIKGKIHIFKYLNIEACKIAPDLPDYDRRPMGFGSCHEELYSGRPYGALDSGFNSVDSGDKRWSGNEPTDEFSDLPLRVAEITKEQRLRRESQYQENRGSTVLTNGGGLTGKACLRQRISENRGYKTIFTSKQQKASLSPQKQSPLDSENGFEPLFVFEIDNNTNTIKRRPGTRKQVKSMLCVAVVIVFPRAVPCPPSLRPLLVVTSSSTRALSPANDSADPRVRQNSKQREEELELIEQLRKEQLCLPLHILEEKGLTQVAVTVQALLELAPPKQQQLHHLSAV